MQARTGFTLIEMMITVAIVGIIAAVALPSYERYVDRSHRVQAQALMSEMAQTLERRYSQSFSYGDEATGKKPSQLTPALSPDGVPADNPNRYLLKIDIGAGGGTYTLRAVPVAEGPQANAPCGTLSLKQDGSRGAGADDCWK
ncbi:type IV pilin protein [Pistricoccus aurantiacus]|uniref:type IV pilin protein n=1 Tax=Pistricoccus aurantiacus TaxID=1883414 RepID=UPI003633D381